MKKGRFPWRSNSQHAPKQEQNRLVIFAGPHKTASTTVQYFFTHNASNDLPDTKSPAFQNWTWPRQNDHDDGNYLYSMNKQWNVKKLARFRNNIVTAYNQSNVILGTENFCFFEETGSIDLILNWTKEADPEMIVHYRTPRTEHWLSLWKQFTREGKPAENYTFYEYLCFTEQPFPNQMNPLKLTSDLLQHEWKTHLMDMAGVASDGLDIAHTIACEILQVPCENGWVKGMKGKVVRANQRNRDANLTDVQIQALERVLQQHDCSYKYSLINTHHLTIHHWQELWKDCDLYLPANIELLKNFTVVVDAMREIVQCPNNYTVPRLHLYGPNAKFSRQAYAMSIEEAHQHAALLVGLHTNLNFLGVLVFFSIMFLLYISRRPRQRELVKIAKNKELVKIAKNKMAKRKTSTIVEQPSFESH